MKLQTLLPSYLFLQLITSPTVSARGITSAEGAACLYIASNFTEFPFDCPQPDLAYKCRCRNIHFMGTVLTCIGNYTTDGKKLTKAYDYMIDLCHHQAHAKYSYLELQNFKERIEPHVIEYDPFSYLNKLNRLNKSKGNNLSGNFTIPDNPKYRSTNLNSTLVQAPLKNSVKIPESYYNLSFTSVSTLMNQRMRSTYFGLILLGYWGLVILLATCQNLAQWCFPYFMHRCNSFQIIRWIKIHFICPQLLKPNWYHGPIERAQTQRRSGSHLQPVVSKLPIRLHSIVISIYILLTVILCCISYEPFSPSTVFRCKKGSKYVAYADRTGIIGTTQLPLVFLFAARNNLTMYTSGMSYRAFQVFHKWTSRVVFTLLVLHGFFYLLYVGARGDYIDRWGLLKWRMANAAFIALIATTCWACFRNKGYEFFKMSHKILMIVFTVGIWYHCITLGWIEYIAVSFSIWAFEYVFRAGRILLSGGVLNANCKVLFETVIDGNTNSLSYRPHSIRMEVNHSGWWKPYPGAYCWIYFMKKDMFWQAHPFTVVTACSEQNFNQLVFLIRIKSGLTRKLADYISQQPRAECKIPILVEGAYGSNIPFKGYDNSVFIAGGVGMTAIFSMASDLARINRAQTLRGQREEQRKSVAIVWMIPNLESMLAFRKEIDSLKEYSDILELQIFITKPFVDPELNECMRIEEEKRINMLDYPGGPRQDEIHEEVEEKSPTPSIANEDMQISYLNFKFDSSAASSIKTARTFDRRTNKTGLTGGFTLRTGRTTLYPQPTPLRFLQSHPATVVSESNNISPSLPSANAPSPIPGQVYEMDTTGADIATAIHPSHRLQQQQSPYVSPPADGEAGGSGSHNYTNTPSPIHEQEFGLDTTKADIITAAPAFRRARYQPQLSPLAAENEQSTNTDISPQEHPVLTPEEAPTALAITAYENMPDSTETGSKSQQMVSIVSEEPRESSSPSSHSMELQRDEMKEFLIELLKESYSDGPIAVNFEDKPNIGESLALHLEELEGNIAVIACGPKDLNADVRTAVVKSLKCNKNVDYHEEELLW